MTIKKNKMTVLKGVKNTIRNENYAPVRTLASVVVGNLMRNEKDPQIELRKKLSQRIVDALSIYCEDERYIFSRRIDQATDEMKAIDEKVIKELESIEYDVPRIIQFYFTESMKSNLTELVMDCKTFDPDYIEQLSYLIQAIEEDCSPILILGESGVGKSHLAKKVHTLSKRKDKKFIYLDCASLDKTSIYANLFGAKRGSFTGAYYELPGKLQQANGGTLFIDEVDKAPKDIRFNLLTFIDTKEYEPLGKSLRKANVNLIIGMNKDPRTLVEKGLLEEDFYYRIAGRIITIPPLRKRPNDIITITRDTLLEQAKEDSKISDTLDKEVVSLLRSFLWPGNYRQLKNYLLFQISKSKWEGNGVLTSEQIAEDPPFNRIKNSEYNFRDFEAMMLKYLQMWDRQKGSFTQEFLLPILAKIYKEDYYTSEKTTIKNDQAIAIVDMDGKSTRGSLWKNYLKYKSIESEYYTPAE